MANSMQQAAALLQWYIDAGVDEALQDDPRNYFAFALPSPLMGEGKGGGDKQIASSPPSSILPLQGGGQVMPVLHHAPSEAIAEARKAADAASTLAELEKAVHEFNGCALKKTATKTVFADGNPEARLMLIGEAPGAQEDMQGIPFCGASGALLDKMFAAIGYDRKSFYITNTLFWRPPGNRTPSPEELAICKPFVEKHVALINPALIVLVGGTATRAMLGQEGITRLRGKRFTYRTPYADRDYPVAVIYHPSYLLRAPMHKKVTWQDLLAIKQMMSDLV